MVVEAEAEWDDVERAKMLDLATHEASLCRCGYPEAMVNDPSFVFQPEASTCPVCAASAVQNRVLHSADEKVRKSMGEHPSPTTPLPSDGRHLIMRLLGRREQED